MADCVTVLPGGSVTSVPGFRAAGAACGLKKTGKPDLALLVADEPCVAAAAFTSNRVKAAPVLYDQAVLGTNATRMRGVVINSGCANACTGQRGLEDARATAQAAAQRLGGDAGDYMVMSTGVIGQHLPMDKVLRGIALAASALSGMERAGHDAAEAIMTTDTRPKEISVSVSWADGSCRVAGMAKGAGMIHPDMATLLCALTTDARLAQELAQQALREALDASLNMVTVDGDTSTNDTALLLASGRAAMQTIDNADSPAYRAFAAGLTAVCVHLAKEIARDGEGAEHFIEVTVRQAATAADAKQVAKAIARSPLVKTAVCGRDANWGRIVCAAGYSGVAIDPERIGVWLGDLELVRDGAPYDVDEPRALDLLSRTDVAILVTLAMGDAAATVWTCDLTHGYVDINAHYRT